MSLLPASARVAWWGTAWLRGRIGPDECLDGVLGRTPQKAGSEPAVHDADAHDADVAHVVVAEGSAEPLLLELGALRGAGVTGLAAAFPATGDPVGLRGPAALTAEAIDQGEAVLALGTDRAWVPYRVGRAVEWVPYPANRRPPPDLGEADRELRGALLAAADALAALDVASWRPEVADELHDLRAGAPVAAPAGTPQRAVDVVGRALHLRAVVEMALLDDGGALSVGEAARRRAALEPLERAVRRALTAACSPDGWPPEPGTGKR
ncbi:hypothetical protein JK386_03725 [Nocardioides sp. zg-536]|uniref:Uncharacterized protein n=1 Tax=Nocardioides faecalis TaxID=2803858 RepID=A0A938Y6Y7_9ACTN|nr:hypothetical protein [Nocardioides faecalis]MBM9459000.1 hypothetical protein [Nocardioides faecalis]QVI57268.1 hypothetical protein KG111_08985 [Nocardioides faecalis]